MQIRLFLLDQILQICKKTKTDGYLTLNCIQTSTKYFRNFVHVYVCILVDTANEMSFIVNTSLQMIGLSLVKTHE